MRAIVESEPRSTDHPTAQRAVGRPEMAQVVAAVAEAFGESSSDLREKRGGVARMLVAWLGWYEGWQRLSLIAAALRIRSGGHISNLIRAADEMLRSDTALQQYADEALATLRA